MAVLIAADRMGPLGADVVARRLAEAWQEADPDAEVSAVTLSTGGEGFTSAMAASLVDPPTEGVSATGGPGDAPAQGRLLATTVTNAAGHEVPASMVGHGATVLTDVSEALAGGADDLTGATSTGVGQLLRAALDAGTQTGQGQPVDRIVLGAGPAACLDAGWGMLCHLADHDPHAPVTVEVAGEVLQRAKHALGNTDVVVAASSDEPLVGLHGAGAMLPQRFGIDAHLAHQLDQTAAERAHVLAQAAAQAPVSAHLPLAGPAMSREPASGHDHAERPSRPEMADWSGIGGGVGFALSLLGARVLDGSGVAATYLNLSSRLADLGPTGMVLVPSTAVGPDELRISVAATVAGLAQPLAIPVVAIGFDVEVSQRECASVGITSATAIHNPRRHGDLADMDPSQVADLLTSRARRLARTWTQG